jgi:DNA ligase-1
MLFAEVAATSDAVAATSKRTEKTAALATVLRSASADEVAPLVGFLTGTIRQGRIGVGWASLRSVRDQPAAADPTLTVGAVDEVFSALAATSGASSQERRRVLLVDLFTAATEPERQMLAALVGGELRQGALDGVLAEAVAKASGVPAAAVRRAAMLSGDLGAAAIAALGPDGAGMVAAIGLRVGTFVQPMLASPAADLDDALGTSTRVSIEWKLDGARLEVHRLADGAVRLFTRNGNEVTDRLPGVVDIVRSFPGAPFVLDGEAIGLTEDGSPRKFQDTMSRFGTEAAPTGPDLQAFFFDVLHAEGVDLIDEPLEARQVKLDEIATRWVVPRTTDLGKAAAFADDALARRHEGVMVKDLDAPYEAGRRGKSWRKVKPVTTLDLVVLAAEWGHGRRTGWLSNLHLGARGSDGFVMVGKTFKGLTDSLLTWQTAALQSIAERQDGHVVYVRPELVVEIALDGVQRSTRYPGGVALRFARVKGYRPDKTPADADTIESVQALLG